MRHSVEVASGGLTQQNNAMYQKLECEPMPNVMVALPNIAGAPLFNAVWLTLTTRCRAVTLPRRETR